MPAIMNLEKFKKFRDDLRISQTILHKKMVISRDPCVTYTMSKDLYDHLVKENNDFCLSVKRQID